MSPERWRQVEELYHLALEREPGERTAYLVEVCQGDEELRREVESLLEQDVSGSGVLDRPAWEGATSLLKTLSPKQSALSTTEDPAPTEVHQQKNPNSTGGRQHPFIWVVRVTALVTFAVFAYAAWLLVRDGGTTTSFGWSQESRDGLWHVGRVDLTGPARERLQPGDRLMSLDGDPYVARAGTRAYRRALAIGETYELKVLRDGIQHELTLTVAPRARLASSITWFAVSLVWCSVGLLIGFLRPDRLQARLAFLSATAVGLVFLQVGTIQADLSLWQPLHVVLGYHFFYRFPSGVRPGRFWNASLWLLYLGGGVAAAARQPRNWLFLTQAPSEATPTLATYSRFLDAAWLLTLFVFCAAVVGMVAVIARNYHLLTDHDQRRRIQWVIYASLVGLVPEFWWGVVAVYGAIIGPAPVPSYSLAVCAATVTIPISVAYAVVKHRVLDIKVAVRLGLQYLLAKQALQALLALPIAALVYTVVVNRNQTITQLVTEGTGYLYWIAAAGLSLRFRKPLRQWLDKRFFHEQYDREQVLLGLLDELGKLGSISEVSQLVSEQLELTLHPKAMYLWYRDAYEMVLTYSSDKRLANLRFPSRGGRLLSLLEREDGVIDVPLPPKAGLLQDETRWLARLDVHLIVPIIGSDERLAGMLMLGEKKSEEPYSASDRRLLDAIAKQTAVVRENLQLKAQVGEEQRIRHDVLTRLDPDLGNLLKECPSCGACFDRKAEKCDRDGQPLTLSLPVARTIDGKYRLEQLIGKGGMGAVYEARDLRLERSVAVKIMIGRAFGEELALRRFQREARAAARLNHPNIVSVYDYGALEGGAAYLVMERIRGVTLRAEIDRAGVLPLPVAAEWLDQLLDGVAAAHAQGIVHRDLKPENVLGQRLASGSPVVKILDFGLAKFRPLETATTATSKLTAGGVVIGTLGYMSPEQLQGHEVDQRTDIFAVGVMLVEMLTGRRPFQGETYGELMQAMLNDVYHLPGTSAEIRALDRLLQRCLAKEPQDRFGSAEAIQRELIPAVRACPPVGLRTS